MKATIVQLWGGGQDIITPESQDNEITCIADLKKCDNVLIGDRCKHTGGYEVMIDNSIVNVNFRSVSHPLGGKVRICEIH